MRSWIACLVCSVLTGAVAHSNSQEQDPFINTIERIKMSVAPVVCRGNDEATKRPTVKQVLGTGFLTSETGDFITAAHVLDAGKALSGCRFAIYLPLAGWVADKPVFNVRFFDFTNCGIDKNVDLAFCRTEKDLRQSQRDGVAVRAVTFDMSPQPDGTPVAFTGFPLQNLQPITSRGAIAAYQGVGGVPRFNLLVDKNAWPGVSGGPVYTVDGRVVGIAVQRGVNDFQGVMIARPAAFVREIMAGRK